MEDWQCGLGAPKEHTESAQRAAVASRLDTPSESTDLERDSMAGTEEQVQDVAVPAATATGSATFDVENPATGEVIAHRPGPGRRARSREMAARARARSPAGRRSASRAAARVLRRAQKWLHRQRRARHRRRSSPRPARPTRTRSSPRSPTAPTRSASGPRTPRSTSPTRRSSPRSLFVKGKKLIVALPAARPGRRDRPVELPADQLLRRLHPGAGRRQRGDPQAVARSRR